LTPLGWEQTDTVQDSRPLEGENIEYIRTIDQKEILPVAHDPPKWKRYLRDDGFIKEDLKDSRDDGELH
jgi:hypothetical protein